MGVVAERWTRRTQEKVFRFHWYSLGSQGVWFLSLI